MTLEPQKIDPRIRRTRQMLYTAFRELLAEKGFDDISVQDIAERSTLNRATFYDHFTDKFALLEAMISDRFRALIAARMEGTDPSCKSSLRPLILATCDFLAELSSGCQKHQRHFEPFVESSVRTVLRQTVINGQCKDRAIHPELKATMVSWAITGAAIQWSRSRDIPAEALADAALPTVHAALTAGG